MSCKRYDCLYHPDFRECYGRDYMLLTGEKRASKPGKRFSRYVEATPKEQLAIRRSKPISFV